jgi:hypothetical protein
MCTYLPILVCGSTSQACQLSFIQCTSRSSAWVYMCCYKINVAGFEERGRVFGVRSGAQTRSLNNSTDPVHVLYNGCGYNGCGFSFFHCLHFGPLYKGGIQRFIQNVFTIERFIQNVFTIERFTQMCHYREVHPKHIMSWFMQL